MTNEQLAGKEVGKDKAVAESNLIQLETEAGAVNRASDINTKINLLESSLSNLQAELDSINHSVDVGLERLSDNDLDLTTKVSETYMRLGEIDNTYKTLSEISKNIDAEVKKLTGEISTVATLSAADLERLETSTSAQNMELTVQHEQLVLRVNELVRHSAETSARLSQSIQHNTDALLKVEQDLAAEIDALANVTQERDSALASNLDNVEKEIESSKARILKMEKVDEALAGRATALEASTAELIDKFRQVDSSIELLDLRSRDLSASVDRLQEASARHDSLIASIQDNAGQMARSLSALIATEGKHFRILGGAFVLALLAIAVLYFYQASLHSDQAVVAAQRGLEVDQQIAGLQQDNRISESAMTEVESGLVTLNQQLNDEVKVLHSRLMTMDDQVRSLDGRMDYALPFSQFGKDSVIHGPQWLAQQPAQNTVIQIATVGSKRQLYEVAQRYSHYFSDEMAYYSLGSGRDESYVLVYGNFTDANQASSVMRRMPRYFEYQRPQIVNLGDIQGLI